MPKSDNLKAFQQAFIATHSEIFTGICPNPLLIHGGTHKEHLRIELEGDDHYLRVTYQYDNFALGLRWYATSNVKSCRRNITIVSGFTEGQTTLAAVIEYIAKWRFDKAFMSLEEKTG